MWTGIFTQLCPQPCDVSGTDVVISLVCRWELWSRMGVWLGVRRSEGCQPYFSASPSLQTTLVPNASVPYQAFHKWPSSLITLRILKQRVKYHCPGLPLDMNVWHLKGLFFKKKNHCLAAEEEILMKSFKHFSCSKMMLGCPPWRRAYPVCTGSQPSCGWLWNRISATLFSPVSTQQHITGSLL